jgi:hypothetical protein
MIHRILSKLFNGQEIIGVPFPCIFVNNNKRNTFIEVTFDGKRRDNMHG